jgi:hypothetical protein
MKRPQPTKPSDLRRPQKVGGFLLDDGSDVEDEFEQPVAKRRMTEKRTPRKILQTNVIVDHSETPLAPPKLLVVSSLMTMTTMKTLA